MTAKLPTGTGATLRETLEFLEKYGKADTKALSDIASAVYESKYHRALPPLQQLPRKPLVLHSGYDVGLMRQQLLGRFPQVRHYYGRIGLDTETELLPTEPIYCNQVYGRTDGRFCITKNLVELSPSWVYETWCGDRIDQSGWDASKKAPTCLTCIARRRG